MSDRLDCAGAEPLFSEHHEGGLAAGDAAALEQHLAGCAACRDLFEAVGMVVDALRPAEEVEPDRGLAGRVAAASWQAARATVKVVAHPRAWRLPWRVEALAAGLALLVTGAVLLTCSWGPGLRTRMTQRSANATVHLRERGERLIEDLRVLRVVVATAFEGRMDRVNDRVDDYRKLLERRRQNAPERKGSSAGAGDVRHSVHFRTAPGTGS
jgi:hypothetical protein